MEFYTAYAVSLKILLTLDGGHFHPTETIADKLSLLLLYLDQLLLHVSRGMRWDSDHVVTFTDDLQAIAKNLVRAGALKRVHISLMNALLEPAEMLNNLEAEGDPTWK